MCAHGLIRPKILEDHFVFIKWDTICIYTTYLVLIFLLQYIALFLTQLSDIIIFIIRILVDLAYNLA